MDRKVIHLQNNIIIFNPAVAFDVSLNNTITMFAYTVRTDEAVYVICNDMYAVARLLNILFAFGYNMQMNNLSQVNPIHF